MDIKDIKELIITIDKTSIERVEIEKKDMKIMISKKMDRDNSNLERSPTKDLGMEKLPTHNLDLVEEEFNEEIIIKSPIVGTFYSSASPDSPALINKGDMVDLGQTICIIEAMKTMNEIKSDAKGEVLEILVNNEDIVEFGQPLIRIRRY
jgi:acetyl-CoA carboxylase biotin carboxyl carrier protein